MAGSGPPPAENRRRRNADTYANVQARIDPADTTRRGPVLVGGWLPETLEWYDTWRRAPQAVLFVSTDWQRLRMLVPLVEDYFKKPHHLKLAEIRQSESLLGATHVDRLKGRIRVERPEPAPVAQGVTALDEYRTRLAG